MTDWLFYDDANWMENTFKVRVRERWAQERRERELTQAAGDSSEPTDH